MASKARKAAGQGQEPCDGSSIRSTAPRISCAAASVSASRSVVLKAIPLCSASLLHLRWGKPSLPVTAWVPRLNGDTDPRGGHFRPRASDRRTWLVPPPPREAFLSLMDRVIAAGAMPRLNGSGALGLADVAAGRSDAYIELHINLWDVAAALTIFAEAGAAVSPFMACDGATNGNPIIAAAPGIATALSAATSIPL